MLLPHEVEVELPSRVAVGVVHRVDVGGTVARTIDDVELVHPIFTRTVRGQRVREQPVTLTARIGVVAVEAHPNSDSGDAIAVLVHHVSLNVLETSVRATVD